MDIQEINLKKLKLLRGIKIQCCIINKMGTLITQINTELHGFIFVSDLSYNA